MKKSRGELVYEEEVSDRRATGSVSIGPGARWSADLAVTVRDNQQILLTLRRHGTTDRDTRSDDSVDLMLSPADLDALPLLVAGVIAQARRDGILRAA